MKIRSLYSGGAPGRLSLLFAWLVLLAPAAAAQSPGTCPSTAPYDTTCQAMLSLAYTANLSGNIHLPDPMMNRLERLTRITAERIDCALASATALNGEWERTWGPALVLEPDWQTLYTTAGDRTITNTWDPAPVANTMFVAKQKGAEVYVVAIAGTNAASQFDWAKEDLDAYPVVWPYGWHLNTVRVTRGAKTGLGLLQSMTSQALPGGGTEVNLRDYLESVFSLGAATLVFTGHSLGGALAPVTALWLHDERHAWDPQKNATLKFYAFAGPTPGDRSFAHYVYERFKDNAAVIVNNSLDVVPHAFALTTLNELDTLYEAASIEPSPAEETAINDVIKHVKKAASWGIYFETLGKGTQVQSFTGDLLSRDDLNRVTDCPLYSQTAARLDDYGKEAVYQHVCAYPVQLGLPQLNAQNHQCQKKYSGN